MTLSEIFPPAIRRFIYSALATAVALEAIFDVVPGGWETKILQALTVLGFGVAVKNVNSV